METDYRNPLILVVDDLPENADILKRFLEPKGYKILEAHTGMEALEIIDKIPPDVVLLDLIMPDIDGFEVCKRLKKNPKTRHIPVIVITGLAERQANIQAIEVGADDFLTKPFDSVLLSARIRNSLRTKRQQDQILAYQKQLEGYNLTLENRITERTAQLVRTQEVAVFSLARLAESRDPETGDHLERIRLYARIVAEELTLQPKYRSFTSVDLAKNVFESSPLHDIGKVGIPDRILLKTDKLTPHEFNIMKKHTLIGGETLKAADIEAGQNSFLAMGCDIAFYHHERWDGKGYPYGLAGEQIPLAARIVAVSDVYDALTSKRPYKEPFSHEVSMKIITDATGSQFDPDVVQAFLNRETEIISIQQDYRNMSRTSPLIELMEMLEKQE